MCQKPKHLAIVRGFRGQRGDAVSCPPVRPNPTQDTKESPRSILVRLQEKTGGKEKRTRRRSREKERVGKRRQREIKRRAPVVLVAGFVAGVGGFQIYEMLLWGPISP